MVLVRAKFGLGVAAWGITASREQVLGWRVLYPRNAGTRMYIMNGMSREETQKLGGRDTPSVIEAVYD